MALTLAAPSHLFFGSDIVDSDYEKSHYAAMGNDYIDRFIRKIATKQELELIDEHRRLTGNDGLVLQKIWALKESGFKAAQRYDIHRFFHYKGFEVESGFSSIKDLQRNQSLYSSCIVGKGYVASVAWYAAEAHSPIIVSLIDQLASGDHESHSVRQKTIQLLQALQIKASIESIVREPNPDTESDVDQLPPVIKFDTPQPLQQITADSYPVSLSHHGRFVMTTLHLQPVTSEVDAVISTSKIDDQVEADISRIAHELDMHLVHDGRCWFLSMKP